MKRVLLDINVILDLLLNRSPWAADALAVWEAHRRGDVIAVVAAFSLPTIFYLVRRHSDLTTARKAIDDILATLEVATVDRATLVAAQALAGKDFEDDLQIACALQAGVDALVTRDPSGFAGSSVPVVSPAALVARIVGGTGS